MRTMSNSVALKFRGGYSLLVLNRGKEGQEDYCPSSTRKAEKEAKKRGNEKGEEIGRFKGKLEGRNKKTVEMEVKQKN